MSYKSQDASDSEGEQLLNLHFNGTFDFIFIFFDNKKIISFH